MNFIIFLEPVTKKNHQQIWRNPKTGKPFIQQSDFYKRYETECMYALSKVRGARINQPVNVQCLFYKSTKRQCDLTGLLQSIDDILVKAEVLEDDNFNIVAGHDGSRVLIDRKNPRTEITIDYLEEK